MIYNRSIRLTDETLTGTTTPGRSGIGYNGNEKILLTPQISRAAARPLHTVQYPLIGRFTHLKKMQSA